MNRINAGARSRFGYLFGSAAAKPAPAAKAKARSAQPGPAARPTDFSHLLRASRARGVELPEPGATTPKPRSLAQQFLELQARMSGQPVPAATVDSVPEQPRRVQITSADMIATLKKHGRA